MQKESRDKSTFDNKEKKDFASLSATKKVGIAASGMFLACCVFLCPCFFKKRRESAHKVLAKEPNSSESLALAHLSTIRRTIAFLLPLISLPSISFLTDFFILLLMLN